MDSPIEYLSKREQKILELISEGYENKAIAVKLNLSIKTVEWHKEKIKQKLGKKCIKELYELDIGMKDQ